VLLAFVSLIAFAISGNSADKEKDNKIPDEARAILEKAEEIELLSIDPVRPIERAVETFPGHQRAHCSVTLQLARAARVFDDHDGV
jgi:hypothetical protein